MLGDVGGSKNLQRDPTYQLPPAEAARRQQLASLGPPAVKRALVHATSVLTTRDGKGTRVLSIDMRPLIIHLLAGLEQAGIQRAVVTLGHDAAQVAECVTAYGFTQMQIDFVYLTLGSAVGAVWRNLANSVLAARTVFTDNVEPLLIVRADNLYDARLLRKIADAPFGQSDSRDRRFEAYALVDATPSTIGWATRASPKWARVALAETDQQRAIRCSTRLGAFDAVVAGEVYATTPVVFEVLADLFSQSLSTSLVDAMSALADRGALGVVQVGELGHHWFESRTVSSIFQPEGINQSAPWAHLLQAARELLYSGEWRPTANMPTRPEAGTLEKGTEQLLQLGSTLGEGANGVVVEAEPGPSASSGASSRLAVKMVKMFRAGQAGLRDDRSTLEAVMWEVHVLRQIRGHENVVKLCDVVELADAVYVVLERIEGPDLWDHIYAQPGGRLSESAARRFFRHILAALRHAHHRGFLHCDLKPSNVRLQTARDGSLSAVLVDWGMARQIDRQQPSLQMGTALYASPEQLTGYNADQAWGRAKLGPPADVWALGATLYEMLAGRVPFVGATHEELVANALALNYDTRPDVLSVQARQLVDAMLQVVPSDRASVGELCRDPWTVADGPMPPDTDSVAVELDAADGTPSGGKGGGGARRAALYVGYAALLVCAFLYRASHHGVQGQRTSTSDEGAVLVSTQPESTAP